MTAKLPQAIAKSTGKYSFLRVRRDLITVIEVDLEHDDKAVQAGGCKDNC
jgi:hypothetical protein